MARAGISRLDSLLQRAATGTLISELYSRCIRLSWNIGAGYSEAQKSRFVLPVVTLESYSAFRSDTVHSDQIQPPKRRHCSVGGKSVRIG